MFTKQNAQKRKRKSILGYRHKKSAKNSSLGRKGSDVASVLDSTSDDENGNRRSSRIRDAPPPPPPSPIQLSNDIADCNDCASLDSIDNCLCSIYEIFSKPQELRRQYIAMHFVLKYGGCSDSKETPWDGKGGIMSSIRRDLAISPGVDFRYILEDVRRCKNSGTKYNGKQKEGAGRVPTLSKDSVEAQIVADELEGGSSQRIAWGAVNVYRESLSLEEVTFSVVYTLIQNMKPKSVRIDTHRQGSNNELSRICRARKAWCTQLCVRLGLVDYREVMRKDGIADEVPIPKWYDQQKLTSIKIDQIAFWDETHKKVKPGNTAAYDQDEVLTFPRDANGKVDVENGTYQEVQLAKLQCKYTDEVRLCIGVSATQNEGKVLGTFVYTNKTLLTISDWNKKIDEACRTVKALPDAKAKQWVEEDSITKGKLYWDDSVRMLDKVGEVAEKKFHDAKIKTIKELMLIDKEQEDIILRNGMPKRKLDYFISLCMKVEGYERPPKIDHRQADNPAYESKYGRLHWRNEIKKAAPCRKYACVTDLIDHIYKETRKRFEDTEYRDNFYFYHDALTLMTCKTAVEYMKQKDIYKHWVLPEQGLFSRDHDSELKAYAGRPVGNSPELMPLDNSLNRDIHTAVQKHIAMTNTLDDNDSRKFSLSTPKKGTVAYLKILNSGCAPREDRIIQDVFKFEGACLLIMELDGKILNDRTDYGRRVTIESTKEKTRGGKRERKLDDNKLNKKRIQEMTTHPDAIEGNQEKIEASLQTYESVNVEI